jgi:hypothetical protein
MDLERIAQRLAEFPLEILVVAMSNVSKFIRRSEQKR